MGHHAAVVVNRLDTLRGPHCEIYGKALSSISINDPKQT
jgi:hypothetical protein